MQAAHAEVLHDHDNGPLTGYFGIPDSTEGSVLLDARASEWTAFLLTASHSISDDGNGETIVLGCIYVQAVSEAVEKVPFFGDLPGVGWAFRNKLTRDDKNELLIFVTPQILKDFQALR